MGEYMKVLKLISLVLIVLALFAELLVDKSKEANVIDSVKIKMREKNSAISDAGGSACKRTAGDSELMMKARKQRDAIKSQIDSKVSLNYSIVAYVFLGLSLLLVASDLLKNRNLPSSAYWVVLVLYILFKCLIKF